MWECSAGHFNASYAGISEFCHILEAEARIRKLADNTIHTVKAGDSFVDEGLHNAARQARSGDDATARMLSAGAGRSSYLVARSLDGYVDPRAEGIAQVFERTSGRGM